MKEQIIKHIQNILFSNKDHEILKKGEYGSGTSVHSFWKREGMTRRNILIKIKRKYLKVYYIPTLPSVVYFIESKGFDQRKLILVRNLSEIFLIKERLNFFCNQTVLDLLGEIEIDLLI